MFSSSFSGIYCPGHAGDKRNDPADRPASKDPCGSTVLDTLETREVTEQIDQRAKQPPQVESVEELETLPAGTEPRTSHHGSPGGERRRPRQRPTIFLERARKGHRQSDQLWNCFKGNVGETPERRGGSHMGLPELIDTTWN